VIKITKNPISDELSALEHSLPKAPAPEVFFPEVAKA